MELELDNISAGYGSKTVLSNVSFAVQPGEIVALLGHNGAGKSTTLKTIMGLISARSGSVKFDGKPLGSLDTATRIGMGIRMLPEGRGIFPSLTVTENIDVVAAVNCGPDSTFGVDDLYELFPVLDERRQARAGTLSGGQQQMLAMGLAIIGTPHCLLLDEPSIGLQPNLVERLFDQVRTICRSKSMTAILVEQNVAAAIRIADRVVIMNSGQIVFDGLPDEAKAANVWKYF